MKASFPRKRVRESRRNIHATGMDLGALRRDTRRVAAAGPSIHTIVVEAPHAAAVDALADEVGKLGACTVETAAGGGSRVALEYREAARGRTSSLSRTLSSVERWLRRQPVADVTVWVDGRRFTLARRDASARTAVRVETAARPDQTAAPTASS
jgi:hypothetical protein